MSVRGGPRQRVRRGLALALLATGPAAAAAQTTTVAEPARATVDGSRLRPERRSYRLTVLRSGLPSSAGERVVTVRETTHAGSLAWAIVETWLVPAAVTSDSVVASREQLAPLHWEGTAGGARLAAAVARDTLYGAISGAGLRRSLLVGLPAGVMLSAAMLEAAVPLLPLQLGVSVPLSAVVVDAMGARVVAGQLSVDRVERIQVPAGDFDCLVATLRLERASKTLWVSRDGRGVVKSEERMPDVGDAVLEQALTSIGPR